MSSFIRSLQRLLSSTDDGGLSEEEKKVADGLKSLLAENGFSHTENEAMLAVLEQLRGMGCNILFDSYVHHHMTLAQALESSEFRGMVVMGVRFDTLGGVHERDPLAFAIKESELPYFEEHGKIPPRLNRYGMLHVGLLHDAMEAMIGTLPKLSEKYRCLEEWEIISRRKLAQSQRQGGRNSMKGCKVRK